MAEAPALPILPILENLAEAASADASADTAVDGPAPPRVRLVLQPNGTGVTSTVFVRRPLSEEAIADAVKGATPCAYAPRTIVIPRKCERYIRVRCPMQIAAGHDVAVLPLEDERAGDLGVLVAPTLQTVDKQGYVTMRVINMGGEEVRIPQLTAMARFVIDPREYVESLEYTTQQVLESCHIDPCHDEAARALIKQMLSSRRRLFRSELGRAYAHGYKMHLSMPRVESGEVAPPSDNIRPLPPKEHAALEAAVKKQLRMGLIEPSTSPFRARPMLIPKATGGYRVVLDYRRCNELLVKDCYPLPQVEQRLAALGRANWFSTFDLLMGFHQIELADGLSKEATAFGTPFGTYQYVRAPMGLATSPATFVRLVDAVLRGLPPGICQAYVDDLIVPTCGSLEDHLRDVGMVMDRLIEGGFTVRADKVHLAMRETPFLGFIAGHGGTRPDPAKLAPLLDMTVAQMGCDPAAAARFAGMLGVYYQFLPDLNVILEPFHQLRGKDTDAKTARERMTSLVFLAAFAAAKHALCNVVARARPDFSKPFYIDVDTASSMGIGAVLTQRVVDADEGSHRPLGFFSRRFLDAERRYGVRDQECLGVVEALRHWRPIILGCPVVVRTDHRSLQWLMRTAHPNGARVAGYAMEAQEYDPSMEWVPGNKHKAADCFSRQIPEGERPVERLPLADRLEAVSTLAACAVFAGPVICETQPLLQHAAVCAAEDSLVLQGPAYTPGQQRLAECCAAGVDDLSARRLAKRAAVVVVRKAAAEWQVLVQGAGDTVGFPEVGIDQYSSQTYRQQLREGLRLRGGGMHSALDQHLSGKGGVKRLDSMAHTNTETAFFIVRADADTSGDSSASNSAFVTLTPETIAAFTHDDDFALGCSLRRCADDAVYAAAGRPSRSQRWQAAWQRALLAPLFRSVEDEPSALASIAECEVEAELPLPTFSSTAGKVPSFCSTPAEATGGSALLWTAVEQQTATPPCVAIDLEGKLGGRVHVSLLQASVQAPQSATLVYDTHLHGQRIMAERGERSLVAMLEDPRVIKIMHCCSGDLYSLWTAYQVATAGVFDTGVADCLLRGARLNQQRGLGDVLHAWLGEAATPLEYKGKLQFVAGMFDKRPLPYYLFVYSYQDVVYCCDLYRAMLARLEERALADLCYAVSASRAPVECRQLVDSPVIAVHDGTHVVALRNVRTNLLELPASVGFGSSPPTREEARDMWMELMGLPPPHLRKMAHKLRKMQCLGRWALYPCPVDNCQDLLGSLVVAAQEGGMLAGHYEVVVAPIYLRDSLNIRDEQRCLFQSLHYEEYRRMPPSPRGPIASAYMTAVSAQEPRAHETLHVAAATVVEGGRVRLGLCNVVLGKTVVGNQRAALVVHDASHVYVLVDAAGRYSFPSHPLEVGSEPFDCALKGFDIYAGGVRQGGRIARRTAFCPRLSSALLTAQYNAQALAPVDGSPGRPQSMLRIP